MPVRIATISDIESWVEIRALLWPEISLAKHRDEALSMLAKPFGEFIACLDVVDRTNIRAFAEATLRHEYVNGCETSPVAYLEGIFVRPEVRKSCIGANLLQAVESWARVQGCSEIASDTEFKNIVSQKFHEALGFEETDRVVYFRKLL